MLHIAYYSSPISRFCSTNAAEILGQLTEKHGFALEIQQRIAWQEQIRLLQRSLRDLKEGAIYFEFSIPRMGKRADVVLIISGIIFVVEFKVGASDYDRAAINQVHDYALDLKNFHKGSHSTYIIPILIATNSTSRKLPSLELANDLVATPICLTPDELMEFISSTLQELPHAKIDPDKWSQSGYHPTPPLLRLRRHCIGIIK